MVKKLDTKMKNKESSSQGFMPMFKLLPTVVTLAALFLSMTAVRFAINEKWLISVAFIVTACILDGIDGRLARMLHASSDLGEQLDSLADFINFGIVPPLIIYLWQGHYLDVKGLSWGVTLLFSACMMLRLARFNIALESDDQDDPLNKYFFTGVPAPVGAGMALLPMILLFEFGEDFLWLKEFVMNPLYLTIYLFIVALSLVSTIPTVSIKKMKVSKRYVNLFLAFMSIFIIGLVVKPWLVLSLMGITYAAVLPFGVLFYIKMKASLK
jgi:CDP-diacylglycerol--serine O-phosphatidyltransferase